VAAATVEAAVADTVGAEEAADTEVVEAAVVAVAEAGAAAADAEDKSTTREVRAMKSKVELMTSKICWIASAILLCGLARPSLHAASPTTQPQATQPQATQPQATQPQATQPAPAAAQPTQKTFTTPKQAADALIQALTAFDVAALKDILGPDSTDLVTSQDPVMDKNRAEAFAAKAKEKTAIKMRTPNLAILSVGLDDFELPIPIVRNAGKWSFDTKVGREEILNRRIGANELDAIQILRGFDEAQQEYAAEKHDDSKVNQYAQRIISTPGKQDGLAWKNPDGSWGGPVGEGVAKAIEQGYSQRTQPFHGYYFKVLKGQGPAAPLGEMDFVVKGAMIGGFALAAAPAQYRVTGVKTFIVGPNGIVYEKDLGPDTLKSFESLDRYNPDNTWKSTKDQWPDAEP
jgi:hypothetical protein